MTSAHLAIDRRPSDKEAIRHLRAVHKNGTRLRTRNPYGPCFLARPFFYLDRKHCSIPRSRYLPLKGLSMSNRRDLFPGALEHYSLTTSPNSLLAAIIRRPMPGRLFLTMNLWPKFTILNLREYRGKKAARYSSGMKALKLPGFSIARV